MDVCPENSLNVATKARLLTPTSAIAGRVEAGAGAGGWRESQKMTFSTVVLPSLHGGIVAAPGAGGIVATP